ncbi:hypothetical protein [Clostridium botulinum]|uniref:hypothetical protein n=1 Tax=Clostridium botulinum TaxID=1491 RepID=UPI000376B99B|nr:hypothetical protein [Clostridium botulinum]
MNNIFNFKYAEFCKKNDIHYELFSHKEDIFIKVLDIEKFNRAKATEIKSKITKIN